MTPRGLRRGSGGVRKAPGRLPGGDWESDEGLRGGSGSDLEAKLAPVSFPEPSWGPPGGLLGPFRALLEAVLELS